MITITKNLESNKLLYLRNKWQESADSLCIPSHQRSAIFEQITTAYSESHRAYHNLSHLYSMFELASAEMKHIFDPITFELSIWFHDIIYDVKSGKNELRSADLAVEVLQDFCTGEQLTTIHDLIVSTKRHELTSATIDQQFLLDIDLAVLGTIPEVYQRYVQAIRKEYGIFPDFLYYRGRKKAMTHFLDRKRIYFTDKFYTLYEERARLNILSE